jgi:iron(II)-dependent oxidoreductase
MAARLPDYEAVAFCVWLTERFHQAGLLPEDWQIRLPSEPEWEKAARGGLQSLNQIQLSLIREINFEDGSGMDFEVNNQPRRRYPWGEEIDSSRANFDQAEINTTSAVGCFPQGRSSYGVEDLSGNVWEWIGSLWGKDGVEPDFGYPYDPTDGRENLEAGRDIRRVLRGGAFYTLISSSFAARSATTAGPITGSTTSGFGVWRPPSCRVWTLAPLNSDPLSL